MNRLKKAIWPVLLIMLAIGAGPASGAFWQWSKTASQNSSADPTINWAEGMSPSSVNDSARAMMARAADYRDDISGLLTTTGTSTAYTVSTNQGFNTVPPTGTMITITPHATNGADPTLSLDAGTPFPIQLSPGVAPPLGSLVLGTPYRVTFSGTAWIVNNVVSSPYSIPIGGMIPYTGATAPNSGFVLPYGQCISRTTYAAYFALVGTSFGGCDGSTTFGVPDIRGRVVAGMDNMGGSAAGRLTSAGAVNGSIFGYTGGSQFHSLTASENGQHSHTATTVNSASTFTLSIGGFKALVDLTAGVFVANGAGSQIQGQSGLTQTPAVTIPTSVLNLSTSINNSGSGTPHNIVQPTIVFPYILRVL